MGFFGPPFTNESDHPILACEAALAQRSQLEKIKQLIPISEDAAVPDLSELCLQVGIATGELVVGNMGSNSAKSYTVMGDTVNLASRLKGVSKQYGVAIAINEGTKTALGDLYSTRELDLIQVVGKAEAVKVYELLGVTEELDRCHSTTNKHSFAKGLAAYRQQQWDEAMMHFENCSTKNKSDPPALLYIERIQQLRQQSLPADWDGVWQLTQK